MAIDCCKSYVGKQIIGLLPSGAEECLYVLAINSQDYFDSSFIGWTLNGNDFITELANYGIVYEYTNDTGAKSVYVYYTGTQPTDLNVTTFSMGDVLFTIRKASDYEGGSCDLVCYQASFVYGYEYTYIDYFSAGAASPRLYGAGQPIDDELSLYGQLAAFLGTQITVSSVWNGSQYVVTINNAFNLGGLQLGDGAPVYTAFTALPCEIVPPTPVPLAFLDAYPGAGAAYSVRKLSSSYTGAALRVRRSSDNLEQDIGFVGFNLDTTALSSFVGAANGQVTIWYDQTGNGRNMTQTVAGRQPQIVNSGVIIYTNSDISINFSSAFSHNLQSSYGLSNGPFSTIGVVNVNGTTSTSRIGLYQNLNFSLAGQNSSGWGFQCVSDLSAVITTTPSVTQVTTQILPLTNNSSYLIYSNWNGNSSVVKYRRNGINATSSGLSGTNIRKTGNPDTFFNGFISEFIIYPSDQASNVAGMETIINGYYNIYP